MLWCRQVGPSPPDLLGVVCLCCLETMTTTVRANCELTLTIFYNAIKTFFTRMADVTESGEQRQRRRHDDQGRSGETIQVRWKPLGGT